MLELIGNLNRWRRKFRNFLHYGKMLKSKPVSGAGVYSLKKLDGTTIDYPSLLTSSWEDSAGSRGQFVVNFLKEPQTCSVSAGRILTSPDGEWENCSGTITVAPLSAVLID